MIATESFQHYKIIRRADGELAELGRGAMGVTYKAIDTNLHCAVALKVVNVLLLGNAMARARFLREARSAAGLRHPNVASVYHLCSDEDCFFYAMEFIDGETVDEYIRRQGPADCLAALDIILQVTRALVAASRQNLIHRDIKPANIMLVHPDEDSEEERPQVKLIDFGLAKSLIENPDGVAVTVTGFVGTPQYASPEQLDELPLDIRSDIYSLGITLWFLLVGRPPFLGSIPSLYHQHLNNEPPFGEIAHLPKPAQLLIGRMLQKNPEARPQTAVALRNELIGCIRVIRSEAAAAAAKTSGEAEPVPETETALVSLGSGNSTATLVEEPAPAVGDTLDACYRLEADLGQDGSGQLFRAVRFNPSPDRIVSLKVLPAALALSEEALREMERVVGCVRNAPHPGIVGLLGFGRLGKHAWIAKEWISGFTLVDLLRARRYIEPRETVPLLGQIAAATDHARSHDVRSLELGLDQITVHFAAGFLDAAARAEQLRSPLESWPEFSVKIEPTIDHRLPVAGAFKVDEAGGVTLPPRRRVLARDTKSSISGLIRRADNFVPALAALAYELLGGPVHLLGPVVDERFGHYVALSQLSAEANDILRSGVLGTGGFACDSDFAAALARSIGDAFRPVEPVRPPTTAIAESFANATTILPLAVPASDMPVIEFHVSTDPAENFATLPEFPDRLASAPENTPVVLFRESVESPASFDRDADEIGTADRAGNIVIAPSEPAAPLTRVVDPLANASTVSPLFPALEEESAVGFAAGEPESPLTQTAEFIASESTISPLFPTLADEAAIGFAPPVDDFEARSTTIPENLFDVAPVSFDRASDLERSEAVSVPEIAADASEFPSAITPTSTISSPGLADTLAEASTIAPSFVTPSVESLVDDKPASFVETVAAFAPEVEILSLATPLDEAVPAAISPLASPASSDFPEDGPDLFSPATVAVSDLPIEQIGSASSPVEITFAEQPILRAEPVVPVDVDDFATLLEPPRGFDGLIIGSDTGASTNAALPPTDDALPPSEFLTELFDASDLPPELPVISTEVDEPAAEREIHAPTLPGAEKAGDSPLLRDIPLPPLEPRAEQGSATEEQVSSISPVDFEGADSLAGDLQKPDTTPIVRADQSISLLYRDTAIEAFTGRLVDRPTGGSASPAILAESEIAPEWESSPRQQPWLLLSAGILAGLLIVASGIGYGLRSHSTKSASTQAPATPIRIGYSPVGSTTPSASAPPRETPSEKVAPLLPASTPQLPLTVELPVAQNDHPPEQQTLSSVTPTPNVDPTPWPLVTPASTPRKPVEVVKEGGNEGGATPRPTPKEKNDPGRRIASGGKSQAPPTAPTPGGVRPKTTNGPASGRELPPSPKVSKPSQVSSSRIVVTAPSVPENSAPKSKPNTRKPNKPSSIERAEPQPVSVGMPF